jgi:hypothetical protein
MLSRVQWVVDVAAPIDGESSIFAFASASFVRSTRWSRIGASAGALVVGMLHRRGESVAPLWVSKLGEGED